jgi:Uma2 family endonuclease
MSTAPAPAHLLTDDEFFDLPEPLDGSKLELVRGEVVSTPAPELQHGETKVHVGSAIKLFLRANKIGRVAMSSGFIVGRKPDTVRGPDISYYSKERLPLGQEVVKWHDQPADLCVEVISPSNTKKELRAKIKEYFFAGVRAVWVVDPEDRSVTILNAPDEGRTFYDDAALDGGTVLPGFACKVSDLFA